MTAADAGTIIPTRLLLDTRLSYEARGVYGFLAAHNFQVDIRDLAQGQFTAVYVAQALEELQQYGYLTVDQ